MCWWGNYLFVIFAVLDVSLAVNLCINCSFFTIVAIIVPVCNSDVHSVRCKRTPAVSVINFQRSHMGWQHVTYGLTRKSKKLHIYRKTIFFHTHLHSTPPLRGTPSDFRHNTWRANTRMIRLSESQKVSRMFNRFDTFDVEEYRDLKIRLKVINVRWKMAPFDGVHRSSTVSMVLFCIVSEIMQNNGQNSRFFMPLTLNAPFT